MLTIGAKGIVGPEGVGNSGGGQKGDDDGDKNKQGNEHRNATSTGGTPGVNDLGTKTSKEHQKEVDGQNAGKEKGSDGEGLHKLHGAEDGLDSRVVLCCSNGPGVSGVLTLSKGDSNANFLPLKGPRNFGAVQENNI